MISTVIAVIGALALVIGFMLVSVDFTVSNKYFYNYIWAKYDVYEDADKYLKLPESEMVKIRDGLIAYFSGKSDSLQTYVIFKDETEPRPFYIEYPGHTNAKWCKDEHGNIPECELCHMVDVWYIFRDVRIAGWVLFPAGLVMLGTLVFLYFWRQKKRCGDEKDGKKNRGFSVALRAMPTLKPLFRGLVIGPSIFLGIFGILGIIIASDFDGAFWVFHELFFPHGNWSFGNMTTVLIGELFMEAAFIILGCGLGMAGLVIAAGIVPERMFKRKQSKELTDLTEK